MPRLWLQSLYRPFVQELDSMIIVSSFQVRLFCSIISSDAWRNRPILPSLGFLVWIFLTFGNIQEQGLSAFLLQTSLQINTCLFILISTIRKSKTTAKVWVGELLQLYLGKKLLPLPLPTPLWFSLKRPETLSLPIMAHRGENIPSNLPA